MDLQKLMYFVSVAETQNFTIAAKNNFISQPTLSKHINELECELGVRLFSRSNHAVFLTPEGLALLPSAKEIVTKIDNFSALSASLAKSESGWFTIGYSGYWEYPYLCRLVERFSRLYPHVNFSFIREHHGRLFRYLQQGECDIIFALKEESPENFNNKLGWNTIAASSFSLALSNQHPLASKKSVYLSELTGETLIILDHSQDSILNLSIAKHFQNADPFPKFFTNMPKNSYDLMMLVLANKGVSILSSFMKLANIEGISFVDIEDPMPMAEFGVAYPANSTSQILKAFLDLIDETPFPI